MVKPEKANAFINKLGLTEEAIKEIPNEVTTDTKADLLPTAEKLAQKREEAKTKQGVAKKLINEEIATLEDKILKTIEDGRETKESKEGTVRDKPKEESKDQAKAESTGSKETSEGESTIDGETQEEATVQDTEGKQKDDANVEAEVKEVDAEKESPIIHKLKTQEDTKPKKAKKGQYGISRKKKVKIKRKPKAQGAKKPVKGKAPSTGRPKKKQPYKIRKANKKMMPTSRQR